METDSVTEIVDQMISFLEDRGTLPQQHAVRIALDTDEDLTYVNQNGNPALSQEILDAFRERTGEDVVWSRGGRRWRYRTDSDPEDTRAVR